MKKVKIWKHKTNNLEDIKELEKKHKNFTSAKIDAFALENEKVEDMEIEPDDILIVELQNSKGDWVFVPNEEPQKINEESNAESTPNAKSDGVSSI